MRGKRAVDQGRVAPRGHLAMSADVFGCHNWEIATGI